MPIRHTTLSLAVLGLMLSGCADKPAQSRGMFDLSNLPTDAPSNRSTSAIPDHAPHGGGSFATGIGGGSGQMPGAPSGGL